MAICACYRLYPVAVCLVVVLLSVLGCRKHRADPNVSVVFRYDDYSATSPIAVDRRVFEIFAQAHVPLTVGVIPNVADIAEERASVAPVRHPLPEERAEFLRTFIDRGDVELAMHGYDHRDRHTWRLPSEFVDVPFERQHQLLAEGFRLLTNRLGRSPTIFIPPFNTYDQQTLRALDSIGISILSASYMGPTLPGSRLRYLPSTVSLPEALDAVATAKAVAHGEALLVVLFHSYDFSESGKPAYPSVMSVPNSGLTTLASLIWALKADPLVHIRTMAEIDETQDLSAERYQSYQRYRLRHFDQFEYTTDRLLPPSFLVRPTWYLTPPEVLSQSVRLYVILVAYTVLPAIAMSIMLVFLLLRGYLCKEERTRRRLSFGLLAACVVASVFLSPIGYNKLLVLSMLVGATLGSLASGAIVRMRSRFHSVFARFGSARIGDRPISEKPDENQ